MGFAETYRPKTLDEIVGQAQVANPQSPVRISFDQKTPFSFIFWGPPGTGKTCTANIIADNYGLPFVKLNATNASVKDIQKAHDEYDQFVLYLDEIQYFNKKQQQALLPFIEDGSIILIAATTENPVHALYDALISRCICVQFTSVSPVDIAKVLTKIINQEPVFQSKELTPDAIDAIALYAAGDVRRAINLLEMVSMSPQTKIDASELQNLLPNINQTRFDLDGDVHYQTISALQKSIRGSDVDAAVFYLARLLEGGDIISPSRRLLVIACEDIGLAYPEAISITLACVQAAERLGMPEAAKPLTHATMLLALAPKASTNEGTYFPARDDVHAGYGQTIPYYLKSACAKGYLHPHSYPNHWVDQQYLPDDLINHTYYTPGDNAYEQQMSAYWDSVKKSSRQ